MGFNTDVTFGADNSVGSSNGNGMGSGGGNSVGSSNGNGVGSSGSNGVSSGVEVGVDSDLGEGLVCLSIQPAGMARGLAFSRIYITAFTSLVTGHNHPTLASSVNRAVKPPYLLLYAKAVSMLVTVQIFENTQDATVYN